MRESIVQDAEKENILSKMLDHAMTYNEAEAECERLKVLATARAAFMKEVEMETWDEVEAALPGFSKSKDLEKFHFQKGKALPQDFKV